MASNNSHFNQMWKPGFAFSTLLTLTLYCFINYFFCIIMSSTTNAGSGFDLKIQDLEKNRKIASGLPSAPHNFVTPGTIITREPGFMRGHGTYVFKDGSLVASVCGTVERVNKLVTVKGVGGVYNGEVGDVVVGRIVKVMQKRWKVDINAPLEGVLLLSSINLPSGELRRRSAEDELAMREILKEGDMISAEIQSVYNDGTLALHTRSVKYGKLGPGTLIKVPASLIKRRKAHIHNLPINVSVILGNNGYIWISPLQNGRMPGTNMDQEDPDGQKPVLEEIKISETDRFAVARFKNCVAALSKAWLPIYDTSLMYAYDMSMKYECKELLKPEVLKEIGELVRNQMSSEGYMG